MTENEVFRISCVELENWEHTPEELEAEYTLQSNGSIPELEWKNPGRQKLPLPTSMPDQTSLSDAADKETENAQINKEFDFMDETPLNTAQMRVRTPNATPKKKKTTNFAGVLDTMKKHGRFLPNSTAGGNRESTSES
ncbi:hypothetical protein DMENIID0001_102930 [Sergentomyia squamirostris]